MARGSVHNADNKNIRELERKKWIGALYVIKEEKIGSRLGSLAGRKIIDKK